MFHTEHLGMKHFYFILFFLSFSLLWADRVEVPSGEYEIYLPVGWTLFDQEDLSHLSFISDDQSTILEISYFQGAQFNSTDEMYDQLLSGLDPTGEISRFSYLQWESWLADLSFNLVDNDFRGWFLLLDGEQIDYQVTIFCSLQDYELSFPWIISAMDAFRPGENNTRDSGIISQLMQIGEEVIQTQQQQIGVNTVQFNFDLNQIESTQALIEREAKILYQYSVNEPLFRLAWDRYYNLVYRDNYPALIPFFESLRPLYQQLDQDDFIDTILLWIQNFEYASSETFSDLLSPVSSVVNSKGDCDSLALLYLMILEYYEIPGVLMVSEVYSHAMAAVLSDKEGASFIHEGNRYVVAEMTDQIALGQIAADMADMSNWQIISFPK